MAVPPDVRVVRGNPDDAELAALVSAFAVLARNGTDRPAGEDDHLAPVMPLWPRRKVSYQSPTAWPAAS